MEASVYVDYGGFDHNTWRRRMATPGTLQGMGSSKKECQWEKFACFRTLLLYCIVLWIVHTGVRQQSRFSDRGKQCLEVLCAGSHAQDSFLDFKGLDGFPEASSNMIIFVGLLIMGFSISWSIRMEVEYEPGLETYGATRTRVLQLRLRLTTNEMGGMKSTVKRLLLSYYMVTIPSIEKELAYVLTRPICGVLIISNLVVDVSLLHMYYTHSQETCGHGLKPGKPLKAERQNVPAKPDSRRPLEEPNRVSHVSSTSTVTAASSPSTCESEEQTLLGESARPSSQYPHQRQHRILVPSTCSSGKYGEPKGNGRKRAQLSTRSRETPSRASAIELNDNDMDVDITENYSSAAPETSANEYRETRHYMDSGALYHSTYDRSVIKPYPAHLKLESPIKSISGFTGPEIPVEGCGYISNSDIRSLDFVLFIPNSTANLVSVGQLTQDYHVKVVFYEIQVWIEELENGERIGQGHRVSGSNHYVLDSFNPRRPLVDHLE